MMAPVLLVLLGTLAAEARGDSDAAGAAARATDLLNTPWVVALISVCVALVATAVLLAVYLVWRRGARPAGPYAHTLQLVVEGHEAAKAGDKEAAGECYRAAVLRLLGDSLAGLPAATAVARADEALREYNGTVCLGAVLSVALSSEVFALEASPSPRRSGSGRQRPSTPPPPPAAVAPSALKGRRPRSVDSGRGRLLRSIAGCLWQPPLMSLPGPCSAAASSAAARRGRAAAARAQSAGQEAGEDGAAGDARPEVLVCVRCGSRNQHVHRTCHFFQCFSCQATCVLWRYLTEDDDECPLPPSVTRCGARRVGPEGSWAHLQDLTWEASGLGAAARHPTGFGRPRKPPEGCKHHGQVGATCGMAAVNNLLTNLGLPGVDDRYMLSVSRRLGLAEATLRDGEQSVQEGGEERQVAELYADGAGGHFDVQTLQVAFSEAGLAMWYVPPQRLLSGPPGLFPGLSAAAGGAAAAAGKAKAKGSEETVAAEADHPVGYVVHRKDAQNSRQDHWFVVRQHEALPEDAGSGTQPASLFLLQDSLYDEVFELTPVEAHQLLLSLPAGALFAVSPVSAAPVGQEAP